jgi:hypothetical protein
MGVRASAKDRERPRPGGRDGVTPSPIRRAARHHAPRGTFSESAIFWTKGAIKKKPRTSRGSGTKGLYLAHEV